MKNQRQATVETIVNVYYDHTGNDYELNGEVIMNDVFTSEMKKETHSTLFQMFKGGHIQYRPEFQAKVDDDAKLTSYISGLVNNWLRKAKELNNGQAYVAKNPGIRAGSGDNIVRELKKLLVKVKGTPNEAKVQAAIDKRLEEIKPVVEIDTSLIPAELQGLL
jgi:hypothetical protein